MLARCLLNTRALTRKHARKPPLPPPFCCPFLLSPSPSPPPFPQSNGSLLSKYAHQLSEFVRRPFTATTAPLVRTLLEEITDMRKYFAGMGLEVGKLDGSGWLNATIGTYFGVGFAVNFLSTFDADAELPEGLSTLQRMVLTAIINSYIMSVKATGGTLAPVATYLSLSGIGLAIPSVTTTVQLAATKSTREQALEDLAAKLKEDAEKQEEQQQQHQQQHEDADGEAFVVESDDSADNGSVVARLTRRTIQTLYASGESAGKVRCAVALADPCLCPCLRLGSSAKVALLN